MRAELGNIRQPRTWGGRGRRGPESWRGRGEDGSPGLKMRPPNRRHRRTSPHPTGKPPTVKWVFVLLFLASAVYVHLRGRVRHRLGRQLLDHSTFMAPINVLMYAFSRV